MTENLQKEQLSLAYVRFIAALAGIGVARPETDDDSIDLILLDSGEVDGSSPVLGVQVKATADQSVLRERRIAFSLGRKNYDDLRRFTRFPRILVVFVLPSEKTEWFALSEEQMVVRRCAYWTSLRTACTRSANDHRGDSKNESVDSRCAAALNGDTMMDDPRLDYPRLPTHYVEAISPEQCIRYLRTHGWEQDRVLEPGEVLLFRHPDDAKLAVQVLLTHKYSDYAMVVGLAITAAAAQEQRPFWEVYMDMAGRYYVAPHTYSTTPLTIRNGNGAAIVPESAVADVT